MTMPFATKRSDISIRIKQHDKRVKFADDTEKATDYDGTDTDEVQAAYDQTKEMGDADREVSLSFQCYAFILNGMEGA